jgi:hypothetical protein
MKLQTVALWLAVGGVATAAEPTQSRYLHPATFTVDGRELHTQSSFAVLTDEYFMGKVMALKILYTTRDVTPADEIDLRTHGDRAFTQDTECAYLVLFIDKDNVVGQVNATIVLKGRTVGYTIAASNEEFRKMAALFSYDGKQLRLQSAGKFENITWKVNDTLPVFMFKKQK